MRLLFLGDIVGRAGRRVVETHVPQLRADLGLDAVVVNGENAAHGFGITASTAKALFDCGVDCITLGNHSWDQREALVYIEREPRLIRPLNYPAGTPGRGAQLIETRAGNLLVLNALGRIFMDPLDDPFAAVERELTACPLGEMADAVLVDMHCEATSEKAAMAHFCDGRASLVVGSHSHVPSADYRILPGGTGFMTDAGMCGDYQSVIGMQIEEPLRRFTTKIASGRFEPADGEATLCGVFVETGADGLAVRIEPVRLGGRLAPALPSL